MRLRTRMGINAGLAFTFFTLAFVVLSFFSPAVSQSAEATLAWNPNPESNIAGYRIHYGTSSRNYTAHVDAGKQTSYTIPGLQNATTYYLAATAYNTSGAESAYSAEVVHITPAPSCTYSISPTAQLLPASGGSGTVSVSSGTGCAWTAVSNASWILITSNSSSSGTGTVNYSVLANSGTASRTGTVTIAGRTLTVSQSGSVNYTITASAGTGGTISPSGAVTVAPGNNQTFTISPGSGYQISSVTVDGSNVGALGTYTFTNVTASHTISASFTLSSGNWTFCANENGFCSFTGTQTVRYGANGVYTYKSLSNGTICTNSVFGDPLVGVGKQCHIQGSGTFTITAAAGSGGSISPSGSIQVSSGASQTFTIAPASGYQVASVLVDGNSVGAVTSYTFSNVTANHTISASFSPTSGGTVVFAVNSGGQQYTDSDGTVYQSDRNYSGGSTWTTSTRISGTRDDALYQSERYGDFSYSIPLPNGNYTVLLRLAEIYWSEPAQRLFNVYIEGVKVISAVDIYSVVGKNAAYNVSIPTTVTDGRLYIRFSTIADNAKVSAIAVSTR